MAYIQRSNPAVVRAIDSALEKTWEQCEEARREKQGRESRERDHQSLMDRAISRMKAGPRERFVNQMNENKGVLEPRLLSPDEVKKMKMTDAGELQAFKEVISEPVAVRRHLPQGTEGQSMVENIGKLNAQRRR